MTPKPKPKRAYLVQIIDLTLEPPETIYNQGVDVDHLWFVAAILDIRPLLSVRVTHCRHAEPEVPTEAELRALIEELRQALPPVPILLDMPDKASALERGRQLAKLLGGAELQETTEGVIVVYPGEVEPIVFLRWRPAAAGLH